MIPSRGDKIIKIAKGSLKDLIFRIQPWGTVLLLTVAIIRPPGLVGGGPARGREVGPR